MASTRDSQPQQQQDYEWKWNITSKRMPRGTENTENIVTPPIRTGEQVDNPCSFTLALVCENGSLTFRLNLNKVLRKRVRRCTLSIHVECLTEDDQKIQTLDSNKHILKEDNSLVFRNFATVADVWKNVPESSRPHHALKFKIKLTTFPLDSTSDETSDAQEKKRLKKLGASTGKNLVQYLDIKELPKETGLTEITKLLGIAKEYCLKSLHEACCNKMVEIAEGLTGPWFDQWWTMGQIEYLVKNFGANSRLEEVMHYYLHGNFKHYYVDESDSESEEEEKPEVTYIDFIPKKPEPEEQMEVESKEEETEDVDLVNDGLNQLAIKRTKSFNYVTSSYNLRSKKVKEND